MATTMGERSSFEAPDTGNLPRYFRLESRVKPSQLSNYGGSYPQKGTASVVFAASLFPQGASVKACTRWEFIFPKSGANDSQARGGAADNSFVLRFSSTWSTQLGRRPKTCPCWPRRIRSTDFGSAISQRQRERTILGLEFLGCRVGDIHGRAFGWQDGINQRQT